MLNKPCRAGFQHVSWDSQPGTSGIAPQTDLVTNVTQVYSSYQPDGSGGVVHSVWEDVYKQHTGIYVSGDRTWQAGVVGELSWGAQCKRRP